LGIDASNYAAADLRRENRAVRNRLRASLACNKAESSGSERYYKTATML
jgi:hypothetical protein